YTPLDRYSKSIRLLEILPGDDLPISCLLHTFVLSTGATTNTSNPGFDFTALSYTWGPRNPTSQILLNGDLFAIRQNLWLALWAIRNKINQGCFQRYDWQLLCIDAICIDQDNVLERNHQVSLMKEIYSQASQVLVWLGDEREGSRTSFEFIKEGSVQLEYPTTAFITLSNSIAYNALLALYRREYWARMWIVQE
ncbi:hypothetical protein EJ08DRAFT_561504, partial [Tothia fuscella]